jgi:phosphoglycolate phosphatase-like HAD superfamily hydrolase
MFASENLARWRHLRQGELKYHTLLLGPGDLLEVRDRPYDILASHRAALTCAAVLSGGFERMVLTKAEFLFDDVDELEREIDRIDDYFNNE